MVDVVAYLEGAYNSTTGMMNTTLADNNLIPLISPYLDAPATATAIPVNAVDWIKVELRDMNDPLTVINKKSGFLLSNGSLVDLDGTSLLSIKDAPTTSYLAIYHRNHLPIRTNAIYYLSEPNQMAITS